MATPESLVEAFARGMMQGLMGVQKGEKKERPVVVPMESVKAAVAQVLEPLIQQQEAPLEPDFPTPQTEEELWRLEQIAKAEARAKAAMEEGSPLTEGTYDPNMPGGSPWIAPPK